MHFESVFKSSKVLAGLENFGDYVVTVLILYADMFLQHLDTELSEEDVQKITSGSKAKAQITVLKTIICF